MAQVRENCTVQDSFTLLRKVSSATLRDVFFLNASISRSFLLDHDWP